MSGAFLYAISGYFAAEQARLERDAVTAAETVSSALERPAVEISRAISDSTLTSLDEVERRVSTWAEGAGATRAVRDVHVFDARAGTFVAPHEARASGDSSLVPWTRLFQRASEDLGVLSEVPPDLDAAQPALVVPVVTLRPSAETPEATGLVGIALVRFDVGALAQDYAPEALRGQIDLDTTFEIRVRPRADGWDGAWHPDAVRTVDISGRGEIALLTPPPATQILSSAGIDREAPPTHAVGVRYREGSVAERFETARRFGYLFAWLAIVLVVTSTVLALITARRALDLRAAQMHFVAGVSHELRTPIAVIDTAAQNLRDQVVGSADGVREYGDLIQRHADRLSGLVERTLSFAATRSGYAFQDRDWVDVSAVIRDVVQAHETPGREPRVDVQIPHALPLLHADPYGVRVLVENVVSNALKYSEADVSVEADVTPEGLRIRVVDQGPGIPKDERRRVFEPFVRGRVGQESAVGGSGLGLGLVRAVVDSHDARIALSETPGGGATVTVVFPTASLR